MSTVSNLSYDSYAATATPITLEKEARVTTTTSDVAIEYWVNLDSSAQPQVETITVQNTLPVADAYFKVSINGATDDQTYTYFYATSSSDTSSTIATRLARMINTNDDVSAVASTNTVVLTSTVPGTAGAFVVSVSCVAAADNSSVSSKIAATTTTAASGTGKVRKIFSGTISLAATTATSTSSSYPELRLSSGTWFNGANPAVSQSTISTARYTGPLTLDALRDVA